MNINDYLKSQTYIKQSEIIAENSKIEPSSKIKSNIDALVSEAYNSGVMSMIKKQKSTEVNTDLIKSKEITKMLPGNFIKQEIGEKAINGILESIKSCQENGELSIGWEELVKADIINFIRVVYAIGITSGFEIASDEAFKRLYLANQERFLMNGSNSKE